MKTPLRELPVHKKKELMTADWVNVTHCKGIDKANGEG